jgi:L-alanine-DL-glutamate epimerase-like enolase superfamily enzyme
MHLQAGVANGTLVEIHYLAEQLYRRIYDGLPEAKDGWLTLPDTPGLGFTPRADAVREYTKKN